MKNIIGFLSIVLFLLSCTLMNKSNTVYSGELRAGINPLIQVTISSDSDTGQDSLNIFANWKQTNLKGFNVRHMAVSGNTVFAGTQDNGLWYTSDFGESWKKTNLDSKFITSLTVNGKTIYAGTFDDGLWISYDSGMNWKKFGFNGDGAHPVFISGSTIWAGVDGEGLWKSTNGGKDWTQNDVKVKWVTSIIELGDYMFMGTYETKGSDIWVSRDKGNTWKKAGQYIKHVMAVKNIGNTIYVMNDPNGTWWSDDNKSVDAKGNPPVLWISSDFGVSWEQKGFKDDSTKAWSLSVIGDNIFYSTDNAYWFKTANEKIWHKTAFKKTIVNDAVNIGDMVFIATLDGVYVSRLALRDFDKELSEFKETADKYKNAYPKPELSEDTRRFIIQATALTNNKKYDEAIALYRKVTGSENIYPDAYFNLALLYAQVEDYGNAIFEMKKYIMLVPDAKDARSAQDKIYEWELNLK